MKKIVILIIAILIVLGAVAYGLFSPSSKNSGTPNSETNLEAEIEIVEPAEVVPLSGVGSLEALKLLGEKLECTISYQSPEIVTPVTGTYFVSGDSIRGDFEMIIPEFEGTSVSSIIIKEGMMYSWSDIGGQKYGMKANLLELDETQEAGAVRAPVPSDVDVNYDCKVWTAVDGSVFEPPSDVLFQDFSALLETGMEYGTVYDQEI